jgi:16S rRNA G966 N2-methylase RsmD
MLTNHFSISEKYNIAKNIKNITLDMVDGEMEKLIKIGKNADMISPLSKIGNNIVDYFTFLERLETKGKYNVNFFDFLENIDHFKEKKFIQTMINYYINVKNKNNRKNQHIVLKEIYNICISAINIMRPLNCMEIYTKFNAKRVLNFCAGWGGSAVAAGALNIEAFYGIEINTNLEEPYTKMISYLQTKSDTKYTMFFTDAVTFDYSTIDYDTVFASPPYYFIEKYPNNTNYLSKKEMDDKFYTPIFSNTYKHLKPNGHFIINVCKEVYNNVLVPLLGEAFLQFPLKKSKRQNNYTEMVYVWIKKHHLI